MARAMWTAVAFAAASGLACAGAERVRPPWIPVPNRDHPDLVLVTGACSDQPSAAVAWACAEQDARRRLASDLQVPVSALTGGHLEDRHIELRAMGGGEVVDAWVLVSWPRAKVQRVQARAGRRIAITVGCTGTELSVCEGARQRVEALATAAGLTIGPPPVAAEVTVTLSVEEGAEDAGAFFAHARALLRAVDPSDQGVVAQFDSGRVKAGHFSRADASRSALDAAVGRLAGPLEGLFR